jgi:predicted Zn-dependent peptidase
MQPIPHPRVSSAQRFQQDSAVLDAISDVLGSGRTSRLYKSLVKEKKIAVQVAAIANITEKYPSLYIFLAVPSQGHTTAECEAAILEQVEKMKKERSPPKS